MINITVAFARHPSMLAYMYTSLKILSCVLYALDHAPAACMYAHVSILCTCQRHQSHACMHAGECVNMSIAERRFLIKILDCYCDCDCDCDCDLECGCDLECDCDCDRRTTVVRILLS
jgi:hypothetical protein